VNDIDILSGMIRHGHAYEPVFKEDGYGDEGDDYEEGDGMDDEKIDKDADEVAEEELIDVDTGMSTKNKKRRKKKGTGTRGPKWNSLENMCLADAWKLVSFCPITGSNQFGGKYYKGIFHQFNERKSFSEYATIHMIWSESVMSHHWNLIKKSCNTFHGYYEKVKNRAESSKKMVDWVCIGIVFMYTI
jgi:hypothetical protein